MNTNSNFNFIPNNAGSFSNELQLEINAQYIIEVFKKFDSRPRTSLNAISLIKSCFPYLRNIEANVGINHLYYLDASSAIARKAIYIVLSEITFAIKSRNEYVEYINLKNHPHGNLLYQEKKFNENRHINNFDNLPNHGLSLDVNFKIPAVKEFSEKELFRVLKYAWTAFCEIEKLKMHHNDWEYFRKNKVELKMLYKNANKLIYFIYDFPVNKILLFVFGGIILEIILAIITEGESLGFIVTVLGFPALIGALIGYFERKRNIKT